MTETSPDGERWIMVRADAGCSGLWNANGNLVQPQNLPITKALGHRIVAWQDWYDSEESRHGGPPPWEAHGGPIAAVNAEGRAIGHALKAALPPDWTVVVEDCDAWLRERAGAPRDEWEAVLAATPERE